MGSTELVALVAFVVLLVVVVRIARYDLDRDARSWAAAYGVTLTPTNVGFVHTYLRTGRRLRFVCSVAGLVLPSFRQAAPGTCWRVPAAFGILWTGTGSPFGPRTSCWASSSSRLPSR